MIEANPFFKTLTRKKKFQKYSELKELNQEKSLINPKIKNIFSVK